MFWLRLLRLNKWKINSIAKSFKQIRMYVSNMRHLKRYLIYKHTNFAYDWNRMKIKRRQFYLTFITSPSLFQVGAAYGIHQSLNMISLLVVHIYIIWYIFFFVHYCCCCFSYSHCSCGIVPNFKSSQINSRHLEFVAHATNGLSDESKVNNSINCIQWDIH